MSFEHSFLKKLDTKKTYEDKSQSSYGWGDFEPFFNKDAAPSFFQRSDVKFASVPLNVILNKPLLKKLSQIIPHLPEGAYIAGGFMRALMAGEEEITGDIDFFFNSSLAFDKMIQIICNPNENTTEVFGGYTAQTDINVLRRDSKSYRLLNFTPPEGKPPIQLIKLIWFDGPEHVIDSFDLTIVQFVTDGKKLYFNPQAVKDLNTGTLRLHRTQSPIVTLNRLLKYEKMGYRANPEEFKDVADEAAKLILSSKQDSLGEYFYISKGQIGTDELGSNNGNMLPAKWINHAWKYLVESENGRMIFAKIFGSKERVNEDLKQIEKKALDKTEKSIYYK